MINEHYPSSGDTGSISRFDYLFRSVGLFGPKNVYIIWLSNRLPIDLDPHFYIEGKVICNDFKGIIRHTSYKCGFVHIYLKCPVTLIYKIYMVVKQS
jgi:hypothetical protein